MTDEEIKLLQTLPRHWQEAILDREIAAYQRMAGLVPTSKWERGCGTFHLQDQKTLEELQALRAALS